MTATLYIGRDTTINTLKKKKTQNRKREEKQAIHER